MFVVHPRNPSPEYRVDRDFALMLSEWAIEAGTVRPNTLEMNDFNVLTINGKVFPSTAPLICKTGDRVRIRLGNLGATDHHPMHIHGHHFQGHGNRRRGDSVFGAVAGIDGAGRGRADTQHRIHCRCARRLGVSLSHDAPRDESDGTSTFPIWSELNQRDWMKNSGRCLPAYMTMGHTGMDMGKDGRGDADIRRIRSR